MTLTLGIVSSTPLVNQILVMAGIAVSVTFAVYGLVGVIVKIDDVGVWLTEKKPGLAQRIGRGLLFLAPRLMKGLTILGTVAMFLVGGGIINHGIPSLTTIYELAIQKLPNFLHHPVLTSLTPMLTGLITGMAMVAILSLGKHLFKKKQ